MSSPSFESLLPIVWTLGRLVPALIVTLSCVIYLVKSKSAAGVLMLVGNLLGILITIGSTVLTTMLRSSGFDRASYLMFANVTQAVGIIASLLFAAGLFVLVATSSETGKLPA